MDKIKLFTLIFFTSLYFFNCSSSETTDSVQNETKIEKDSNASQPSSQDLRTATSPSGKLNSSDASTTGAIFGLAMNSATAMVIACLGIENKAVNKSLLIDENNTVQEKIKQFEKYKADNPEQFPDNQNNIIYFNSFKNFASASAELISQLDKEDYLLISYGANVNKAYNDLGGAYSRRME